MIIAVADERIADVIGEAKKLKTVISVSGYTKDWVEYYKEIKKFSAIFERPSGNEATKVNDSSLLYFTSGTSPLGHIITARFWQNLNDESLHLTVAADKLHGERYTDSGCAKPAFLLMLMKGLALTI
nr:hypothetical protein [Candidatus Endomicrobium trichonymphae]